METSLDLAIKLAGLFEFLPLERAMPVLTNPSPSDHAALVRDVDAPAEILAGLWLYVDELERSHAISQGTPTATGAYWHAIMHRREGDFANARYWLHQVGNCAAIADIGYDPYEFVDDCNSDSGQNSPKLLDMQRREWKAVFDACLREAALA